MFYFYLLYMTAVFIIQDISADSFYRWINIIMFGVFFIVLSRVVWNKKEIRMIFKTVFISSLVYSLILLFYNHDLFHLTRALMVHGVNVNRNAAAYTVAPGAICGLILFFYYKSRYVSEFTFIWKAVIFLGTALDIYVLLALGQRGGFFSFCIGALFIMWEYLGMKDGKKTARRFLLIPVVAAVLFTAPKATQDTHANRLFDYENVLDDNGRDDLNNLAKQLIREKPVFGGGYGYWERESGVHMGLHNGFLYIMVIGGSVAGFLIGVFLICFVLDAFQQRSLIPYGFIFLAMVHFFEDSGLDYLSYIPMILAYILIQSEVFGNNRTRDVFLV